MERIPLTKPYITNELKTKVCDILDSGYLTEGKVTEEFEDSVAKYTGASYAIAVPNATVGLELALRSLGVGSGDEVIIPDFTYPATAYAVQNVRATPIIVDVEPYNMLISYEAIKKAITPQVKVIMPVSIFGNPLDYEELWDIADDNDVYIIEDAACGLGSKYKGTMTGNLADITVFSFHPRKLITTGEGGMITTNIPMIADWINSYKNFGLEDGQFVRTGTNYKMSDVNAGIGLVQMMHIDEILTKRRELAFNYHQDLSDCKSQEFTRGGIHSWQSYCVFVENRDKIRTVLASKGIETQIGTYSLHKLPIFWTPIGYGGSSWAYNHCLALPLYPQMTDEEQSKVINEVNKLI